MGQSRITTDSPAGVLLLGRLFDSDVFLQGFRASRRSSVTDKVLRDLLEKVNDRISKRELQCTEANLDLPETIKTNRTTN